MMKKNGFAAILVVLIILAIGISGYFFYNYAKKAYFSTTIDINNKSNWQIFKSKNEGFTLSYPPNWLLIDTSSTNCGNPSIDGSKCRERFNFISPDGISVRYAEGFSDDRWDCGVQVACPIDVVKDISELNIPNYGKMYLIRTEKINNKDAPKGYYYPDFSDICLHVPTSPETMPKVGENIFKNYSINYSLPSRFVKGERFSISVHATSDKNNYFRQLMTDKFYNLPSVKQAEEIMRSISY